MAYGYKSKTRTGRPMYRRRVTRRKTTTRKRVTRKVSFAKRVTSIVNRTRETKHVTASIATGNNIQGGGLANEPLNNFGYIVPNVMEQLLVVQGLASNDRVGDVIEPLGLYINGFVKTNEWSSTTNNTFLPFDVKIIVFKYTTNRDLPGTLSMKLNTTHDPPTQEPITGTINNEMLPFQAQYKVLATRRLRLRPPLSRYEEPGPSPGNETVVLNSQTSNAPFYRRFKIKVPVPKKLHYALDTALSPQNCWFSVGAYILDSTGAAIVQSKTPASIFMNCDMYYKDA